MEVSWELIGATIAGIGLIVTFWRSGSRYGQMKTEILADRVLRDERQDNLKKWFKAEMNHIAESITNFDKRMSDHESTGQNVLVSLGKLEVRVEMLEKD